MKPANRMKTTNMAVNSWRPEPEETNVVDILERAVSVRADSFTLEVKPAGSCDVVYRLSKQTCERVSTIWTKSKAGPLERVGCCYDGSAVTRSKRWIIGMILRKGDLILSTGSKEVKSQDLLTMFTCRTFFCWNSLFLGMRTSWKQIIQLQPCGENPVWLITMWRTCFPSLHHFSSRRAHAFRFCNIRLTHFTSTIHVFLLNKKESCATTEPTLIQKVRPVSFSPLTLVSESWLFCLRSTVSFIHPPSLISSITLDLMITRETYEMIMTLASTWRTGHELSICLTKARYKS